MWEPQLLTTLSASTACYRDSFVFYLNLIDYTGSNGRKSRKDVEESGFGCFKMRSIYLFVVAEENHEDQPE
jgi:hypothetical protein